MAPRLPSPFISSSNKLRLAPPWMNQLQSIRHCTGNGLLFPSGKWCRLRDRFECYIVSACVVLMYGRDAFFDTISSARFFTALSRAVFVIFGIGLRRKRPSVEVRVPHVRQCFESGDDASVFFEHELRAKQVFECQFLWELWRYLV